MYVGLAFDSYQAAEPPSKVKGGETNPRAPLRIPDELVVGYAEIVRDSEWKA